jgi:hypothetical protein
LSGKNFFKKFLGRLRATNLTYFVIQNEQYAATEIDDVAKAIADAFQYFNRIVAALGEGVVVARFGFPARFLPSIAASYAILV